jgi:hypothetical protein
MAIRPIFTALGAIALLWVASAPASAATYVNVRYGYAVDYPADLLIAEPEADAGDGRMFHAHQGTAKMSVWAEWKMDGLDQSPEDIAREAGSHCAAGRVAYKVVKPRLVALSCVTAEGRATYQKTLIGKAALTTVTFDYPATERRRWDPVVASIAASMRQGTPGR